METTNNLSKPSSERKFTQIATFQEPQGPFTPTTTFQSIDSQIIHTRKLHSSSMETAKLYKISETSIIFVKIAKLLTKFSDIIDFDQYLQSGRFVVKKAKDPIPVAALFAYIEAGFDDKEIADLLGDIDVNGVRRVRDFIFEIL